MVKYWIITVSEENWQIIKMTNIYGAPEKHISKSARNLISQGDILIFYVQKRNSKELGGKFVGAFKVVSEWCQEGKILWPDEVRDGKVKYPWRVKLEPIKVGVADFDSLVPKLEFIKKKERPNVYLLGTPANFRRPILEHDAKVIINALS